ncbi:hypothetical protein [Streptomyces sp. Ag109_O5-1]|uniref:hypothetical protein n=1 Tax=Streptomyces sp. Ag109_O5-1 TaxID=1938851 RepID=UPI0016288A0B|nr:hypothetical protein [Streptomyces sp. Ag109_O5-1]
MRAALREHRITDGVVELPAPVPTTAATPAQLGCTVGTIVNSLVFSVDDGPCPS